MVNEQCQNNYNAMPQTQKEQLYARPGAPRVGLSTEVRQFAP